MARLQGDGFYVDWEYPFYDTKKAIPMGAACFDHDEAVLKVGSPVSGFLEGSNSKDHFGAQLTGWDVSWASEWKLLSPASFPAAIETNGDVIAALPQLRRDNFPITHAPVLIGCFHPILKF